MRRLGTAVGHYVASPVVESMDINAIVNEIDWNEVLDKVDLNEAFFDKIDVNRLLERVDINRHLDRIDFNKHLDRVDWNAIVDNSNVEEIISRSTSGVFSVFMSLARTRLAWVDQWGQRLGRCACCRIKQEGQEAYDYFPPRPGRPEDSETIWKNPRTLEKKEFERVVQFRTSGATNRLLAFCLDQALLATTSAVLELVINQLAEVFLSDNHPDWQSFVPLPEAFELLAFFMFEVLYYNFLLGCFGRTFGMSILGLLMVSENGNRVSFCKVFWQSLMITFNFLFFGWVVGYVRRDGALLCDILGGVRVVYAWEVQARDENTHPEMAMSMGHFVETLREREKMSLLMVPQNLNVQLGGDDYCGEEASLDHSDSGSNLIEITNLEDGASRWSKDNI